MPGRRFASNAASPAHSTLVRQAALYVVVGVAGTLVDFALFWALIAAHAWPWTAVTIAYMLSTAMQFVLNRRYSFLAFEGRVILQARNYAIVSVAQLLLTLALVEIGIQTFGLVPLVAKATSIPFTALGGFLGSRYFAFAVHRKL